MVSLNMKIVRYTGFVLMLVLVPFVCNAQSYVAQPYQIGSVPVTTAEQQMAPTMSSQYNYISWYNNSAMPNAPVYWSTNNGWPADAKAYQGSPYDHSTYGGNYWGQQVPGQDIRSGGFTQGGTITSTMAPLPPEQNLMYPVLLLLLNKFLIIRI
jgi:hypothetical protein